MGYLWTVGTVITFSSPPTHSFKAHLEAWWKPVELRLSFLVAQKRAFSKTVEPGYSKSRSSCVCRVRERPGYLFPRTCLVIFCLSPQRLKSESHFRSVTDKLRGICALALSVLISALPLTPLHPGKSERAEGTATVSRATGAKDAAGLDRCLSLFS